MDKLFIIIPAYNEEENIKSVVIDWYEIIKTYNGERESRLVVIDDGSKDKTFDILTECAKDMPMLIPLKRKNSGHGATILYGYQFALDNGADYIFQTDSDGQTLPSEFHDFWKCRNKYDMVIGYRRKREDGFSRIIVTKTLKLIIWLCFGVSVTDANTPFRIMSRETLANNIKLVPYDFNLSNIILTVAYIKSGQKVNFIPITFRPRQGGVNSINLKRIVKIGIQALSDFGSIRRRLDEDVSR